MKYSFHLILALASAIRLAQAQNFWRLPCRSRTTAARIDPIMSPGELNSHLHTVFGSGGFSDDVTQDDLLNSDCTSCAVTQDRSAYWTAPLMFEFPNGSTTMVNQDGGMLVYYFVYGEDTQPFPENFRMIAGDQYLRNFSGPVPDLPTSEWTAEDKTQSSLAQKALGFNCLHYDTTNEASLYRHSMPSKEFLDQNCRDGLRLELMFPSCWNGRDVDSEDHKSHMAYPDLVKDGSCPEGFETRLITLFYETKYDTQDFVGVDGQFVLSTGDPTGCGYHGDFIQGWQPDILREAMTECNNPSGEVSDCPVFTVQSDSDASACQVSIPEPLSDENPFFNVHGLLGGVPIQHGPEPAVPYGMGQMANNDPPHLTVPKIGVIDNVDNVVSRVVDGLVAPTDSQPASAVKEQAAQVSMTTSIPTQQASNTDNVGAARKCERGVIYETVVVDVNADGVPIATHTPINGGAVTTTSTIQTHPISATIALEKRDDSLNSDNAHSPRRMHHRHQRHDHRQV